uniref:Uncharacterized protein n=1 Tax=Rhodnius prolixus TaxID=13249 RepID=T1HVJ5_RHOPR
MVFASRIPTLLRGSGSCLNGGIFNKMDTATYSSLIDKSCGEKKEETCVERENPCEITVKLKKGHRKKPPPCPEKQGQWQPPCEIYMQEDKPYRPPSWSRFVHECCPPPDTTHHQPCDPCDDSANQKETQKSIETLKKLKRK